MPCQNEHRAQLHEIPYKRLYGLETVNAVPGVGGLELKSQLTACYQRSNHQRTILKQFIEIEVDSMIISSFPTGPDRNGLYTFSL